MPIAFLTARRVPKTGAPLSECEDATSPTPERSGPVLLPPQGLAVAVADGATTYSYSQEWANILCTEQEKRPLADVDDLMARLPSWQTAWQAAIQDRINDLPWFAAAKVEQGAFSTFLQLTLHPDGTWQALAIGDSCLVQCRKGKLVWRNGDYAFSFPLQTSEAFSARPYLLPTRPDMNSRVREYFRETQGKWQAGDEFLLMTDALAAWFVRETEQGRTPQETLRTFTDQSPQIHEDQDVSHVERHDYSIDDLRPLSLYLSRYSRIEEGNKSIHRSDGIIGHPSLDEAFGHWVEESKTVRGLKDDDVSFVHVSLREA
ncbi:hypothetical protein GCM10008959_13330 [Deinococcus seoulensis]|uniref:PPM-type phosphatase domain-containing protein n=1 Tax=Deinococcus seoulensis TaxID=1837379 RepID=A0ABQ2RSX5_9DEIO|nr:protein phosphatase 2C domain-containing protein [Deinococcus seoulensis]GGR53177.1 hypothetical protein GCM10008959_13330 [Deinococcus seoulensis]